MIKLIASDMDGTILNTQMLISEENTQAVKDAQAQGIEFMVATGRNRQEALSALDDAGIHCAMICLNGAQVFDKEGNILFNATISKEETLKVLDVLDQAGIYYEVATNKGVYSENQTKRIESFVAMITSHLEHITYKMAVAMASANLKLLSIHYVDSIREELKNPDIEVLKVICFSIEGGKILEPVGEKVSALGSVVVTSSGFNNIEINHKDAQKGIALRHVAKDRGIDLDDVMAIGDNFNDVSMLQIAGVSFAMGNAEPGVKNFAKYETDTNLENGVGKAIKRAIAENL